MSKSLYVLVDTDVATLVRCPFENARSSYVQVTPEKEGAPRGAPLALYGV
jgi:hypothetical protein